MSADLKSRLLKRQSFGTALSPEDSAAARTRQEKRSAAAKRGWETRRINAAIRRAAPPENAMEYYFPAALAPRAATWRHITTAPESGYIIGAWRDGSRWRAAQMFLEHDEWVDVFSDRICRPTHWSPLPEVSGERASDPQPEFTGVTG